MPVSWRLSFHILDEIYASVSLSKGATVNVLAINGDWALVAGVIVAAFIGAMIGKRIVKKHLAA